MLWSRGIHSKEPIPLANVSPYLLTFKGAQVWDFDVLDFYNFFIMKSL